MAIKRRQMNLVERNISQTRVLLRKAMVRFAKDHRGCDKVRGCGCHVDRSLTVLEQAEAELFKIELSSYADPKTPQFITAGE